MVRDYRLYLKDILEAMEQIETFTNGMSFEEFKQNDMASSAVIRKFEIIGEATKNVPHEIRQEYSHIPWRELAGMRDVLIHAYFRVDYSLVWRSSTKRIPALKPQVEKILEEVS